MVWDDQSFDLEVCPAWIFLKNVDLGEAHCGWVGVEVVDASGDEIIIRWEPIFVCSGLLYKHIRHNLDNLCSFQWSICIHIPLVQIFFSMELNSIEGIFFRLHSCHEFLVVRSGCCGG